MRVLMGGASGMIGSSLSEFLIRHECPVVKLVRRKVSNDITEIYWDPEKGELDESKLEEFDAVIHLGGFNIAKKVWSSKVKKRILETRVKSTQLLAEKISKLKNKPKVFITASGMNIYGYTKGDAEPFTEKSKETGHDFLADVVRQWEAATKPAKDADIRVIHARFSAVLGKEGGLLKKVLPIFRMAAGGRLGKGHQIMSWVDIDDAVEILWHCLQNESISGPVNVASPNAVTNREFTKALAKAVGLPAFLPMPEFMIKTIFAEMGEVLMLSSIKCVSSKLGDYEFKYPTIRESLNNQLGVNVEASESENKEEAPKEDENPA
ncbi:MAG: TIGR01777 family oxidoreductase [Lentisphaeraceae bacterium]|nr:TIGR01777 family oxidoreductase [Lentisphaeraceae bacterium]